MAELRRASTPKVPPQRTSPSTAGPSTAAHGSNAKPSTAVHAFLASSVPSTAPSTAPTSTTPPSTGRWDFMKKDYVLWAELKNSATGLGRCPIRKTVDASDEWWTTQIGLNKEFAKFRDGPPPNLECLEIMFGKSFVTGDTATVPGMVLRGEASLVLLEGSGSSTDPANEELIGSGSKRKNSAKGKGKKSSKYFEVYKKAACAISSQCTPSIQSRGCPIPTIKEVIQLMIECGVVQGTPFFSQHATLL